MVSYLNQMPGSGSPNSGMNQGIIETPDDDDYYAAEVRRREAQAARTDMEKQGYSEAEIEQVLQENGLLGVQPNQQLIQGFQTQGQQPVQQQPVHQQPAQPQQFQQQMPQNQGGGMQNQGIVETPDDDDYYAAEVRRREAQAARTDMEKQGYSEAEIEQVLQERGLINITPNQHLTQDQQPAQSQIQQQPVQQQHPAQPEQFQQQVPQNQGGGMQNQGIFETPDDDDYYAAEVRRREA
eukprot:CAMPEP_0178912352 /NCGR_PEP_ID=MMETSP0786-20121207/10214_1 /TAXON_ID=186022 /ORGANISM="Thalassionema frauenfeldii, Strain CCMP 1798" /LENGTH=237 /DNA_ID=CAMNT_0020584923 /DNA_START=208 /DNA_END=918 /DNA_ORIENTATION=-